MPACLVALGPTAAAPIRIAASIAATEASDWRPWASIEGAMWRTKTCAIFVAEDARELRFVRGRENDAKVYPR